VAPKSHIKEGWGWDYIFIAVWDHATFLRTNEGMKHYAELSPPTNTTAARSGSRGLYAVRSLDEHMH
jgi:hypothetical protein